MGPAESRDGRALASLSLTLMVGGLITLTALWRRSEADATRFRGLLDEYTKVANTLYRHPGIVRAEDRQGLLRGLEEYQSLVQAAGTEQERSHVAYSMLQLALGLNDLGDREPALRATREAVAALRRLSQAQGSGIAIRSRLADGLSQLHGIALAAGRTDEADTALEEAVSLADELVRRHASDHHRGLLATFQSKMAMRRIEQGRLVEAETLVRESLRGESAARCEIRGRPDGAASSSRRPTAYWGRSSTSAATSTPSGRRSRNASRSSSHSKACRTGR